MLDAMTEQTPDGKATIALAGSLTLGPSLSDLDAQIRHLVEGNVRELTLNLGGIDYADSRGLGLIVQAHGLLKARDGSLRLTGVRPRVMELLRLTAVDTVIAIDLHPTLPPQE
ncbi:MAG TPA: STAS domain-containing protein [Terracidiphilus sp.]|jgi:anti-sigma B factor antagonist